MRKITLTVKIDDIPTKIKVEKIPWEKRFKVLVADIKSEYVASQQTEEVVYDKGLRLPEQVEKMVIQIIIQYFLSPIQVRKIIEEQVENCPINENAISRQV